MQKNEKSAELISAGGKVIDRKLLTIRDTLRSGDAGYIIYMHGWIYKKEQDYSTVFEGYVAQTFYEFLQSYDSGRDHLWVAEYDGQIVGCVGVMSRGERAQLRWFLLHPDYRGIGLGKRLLTNALGFCREKGYKSVYLETTGNLETAIAMYTKAGFRKVAEKENNLWRDGLIEVEMEMQL